MLLLILYIFVIYCLLVVPHLLGLLWILTHLNEKPACTIVIRRKRVFLSLLRGVKGVAASYIRGDWDCDHIDVLVEFIHRHRLEEWAQRFLPTVIANQFRALKRWFLALRFCALVMEELKRDVDRLLVKKNYNIGNDFYRWVLGPTLAYTCAHWDEGITTLEEAQTAKFEYIDLQLGLPSLEPGKPFQLCDIGCGNGPYLKHILTKYPWITAVGITTSEEQAKSARKFCKGLPVEIRDMNYKELLHSDERFDAVVSIGMFEAVQRKDYALYARVIRHILKPGGLYFHHCIVRLWVKNMIGEGSHPNPYVDNEVFPGGILPTLRELQDLSRGMDTWVVPGLRIVSQRWLHGHHYDKTIMAWVGNMRKYRPEIACNPKYDERFFRKQELGFLGFAGSFRVGKFGIAQFVYQHVPLPEGLGYS